MSSTTAAFSTPAGDDVNSNKQNAYISPSDNIMSPTTKKLSEIKGRRFGSGKPQSLFAKTVGKQAQAQQNQQVRQNEEQEVKNQTEVDGVVDAFRDPEKL